MIAHFEKHRDALDADAQRRLYSNPLRILDTKNPAMQSIVEAAPRLMDYLGEASLAHFNAVRAVLDANGLPYTINPRLVRGMDYYNLTVFEWVTDRLGSQGTVCGGGRYDYLVEQIGGKPAPAVGWAMGVERVLELLKELGVESPANAPVAYAVVPSPQVLASAIRAIEGLRSAGVSVLMHAGGKDGAGSMKSQFKRADASGARYALIFGEDEVSRGLVSVKPLRDADATQVQRPLEGVSEWAAELLNA